MYEYESDGHESVFLLQLSKVSGHVSTQNGFQINSVPPLHFEGLFRPCPIDMGLFQSLSKVYIPHITLEIDGLIGSNVNFGHL